MSNGTIKRSIIKDAGQNAERYGLEVKMDYAWLGQTLSSDNAGIVTSSSRQDALNQEVML